MQNIWNSDNDDYIWAQYLSGQSDLRPEDRAILEAQSRVKELRALGRKQQEGRMVGNVYVAASPFQHLGQLANAYMGKKGQGEVDERRSKQDALSKDQRTTMIEALRSKYDPHQLRRNGMPTDRPLTPQEELAEEAEKRRSRTFNT
jgi:hypothetical protein